MHENCVPREEFEKVISEVAELKARFKAQQLRIAELEARLMRYENPHTPPSMRTNNYPKREPTGRPPGKREGDPGFTRKLEHQMPDEVIRIKPDKCRRCRTNLGEPVSWERKLVLEIPEPQPVKLLDFRKGISYCPNCGAENIGADPRCPTIGDYGPRTLALANDLRFRYRMSVTMTSSFLYEQYNLQSSRATIIDMTSRTAKMLKFECNSLVTSLRNSSVSYVDETGFYVNGKREWCWGFSTPDTVMIAIRDSRGSGVARAMMGDNYRGVVVSDCYSAYELFAKHATRAKFQKCWAHLLRESHACAQHCEEGKMLHSELGEIFKHMKSFIAGDPSSGDRENEFRRMLDWVDRLKAEEYSEHRTRRLIKRIRKYRENWFVCVLIPGVEPTNNRAERALRPQVILRRLRGSLRSDRGKEDHEIMTSLMSTWKLRGLNPVIQLEHELSQIFAEGDPTH